MHLVNILLLCILASENLLNRFYGLMKEIKVKLLKLGTCKRLREVVSILKGFDASRLLGGREVIFVLKGFNASRLLEGEKSFQSLKDSISR